jgi:hypothetical protein
MNSTYPHDRFLQRRRPPPTATAVPHAPVHPESGCGQQWHHYQHSWSAGRCRATAGAWEARRYAYEQTVHPLGFKRSQRTLAVESDGEHRSRVVWNAEVEFPDASREAQFLPILEQWYGPPSNG